MASSAQTQRPAWQIDELDEEWVEEDIEVDEQDGEDQPIIEVSNGRFDDPYPGYTPPRDKTDALPALPSPPPPEISVTDYDEVSATDVPAAGTVLVHSEHAALDLNKVRDKVKAKNLFSPLALEKMFEPPSPPQSSSAHSPDPIPAPEMSSDTLPSSSPSPPARKPTATVFAPSKLAKQFVPEPTLTDIDEEDFNRSQPDLTQLPEDDTDNSGSVSFGQSDEILETDIPNLGGIDAPEDPEGYNFTFSPPTIGATSTPTSTIDQRQPRDIETALTDPRLKLFQLNYDTYTREHLSAIVDSIPITPSRSGSTDAELRNPKRIRISPPEISEEQSGSNGHSGPRDYVGESKSLMSAIRKNTRSVSLDLTESDLSKVTTGTRKVSGAHSSHTAVEEGQVSSQGFQPARAVSAVNYRQSAAALMSAIKADLGFNKSHNRGLSNSTNDSNPEKENEQVEYLPTKFKGKDRATKPSPSPRKILRRLSAADEVDREIAAEISVLSVELSTSVDHLPAKFGTRGGNGGSIPGSGLAEASEPVGFAPPQQMAGRTTSTALALNRYVSSSTATTVNWTSNTGRSFVKHAGPPLPKMTSIAPTDIPTLPAKVGRMIYDSDRMMWVKERDATTQFGSAEDSEDVFRNIDSFSGDTQQASNSGSSRGGGGGGPHHDQSQSTWTMGSGVVEVMTGIESLNVADDDSSEDDGPAQIGFNLNFDYDEDDDTDFTYEPPPEAQEESDRESNRDLEFSGDLEIIQQRSPRATDYSDSPPRPNRSNDNDFQTPVNPHRKSGFIPRSVLKSGSATPHSGPFHRRSVSFSDGRKDGRILGLHTDESGSISNQDADRNVSTVNVLPSARTKRIQARLEELEHTTFDDTPSKRSVKHRSDDPNTGHNRSMSLPEDLFIAPESQSLTLRSFKRTTSVRANDTPARANATFLTECSFGVTHDKLVQVITDVQPWVPYWEELDAIDLADRKLESVTRLKEFLPKLRTLNLKSNKLSWLSGVPSTVTALCVASNLLSEMTSFNHLSNLEVLDISFNEVESVNQLACLQRLRELNADGNLITSLEGLEDLKNLTTVSLRRNRISQLDFSECNWIGVQSLNFSSNEVTSVYGLERLPVLRSLTLDENNLAAFPVSRPLPSLRILKLSGNKLKKLDASPFTHVRTLYLDNNQLSGIKHGEQLRWLENLSLRNQRTAELNISLEQFVNVKRMYISGNRLASNFFNARAKSLVYLEIAGCQLSALPENLAEAIPNIRVLNLNYNFLTDLDAIDGLEQLRKLTVIGSRVSKSKTIVKVARRLPCLEMLDCRMNPCTLPFYLPLLMKDIPGASEKSAEAHTTPEAREMAMTRGSAPWHELDTKFRNGLPDVTYVKRLIYRGLVMRGCQKLRELDGVKIAMQEVLKAEGLLRQMERSS